MFLFRILVYLINVFLLLFAISLIALGAAMNIMPGYVVSCLISYGVIFALFIIIVILGVKIGFRFVITLLAIILILCAIFQIATGVTIFVLQEFIEDFYEAEISLVYQQNWKERPNLRIILDNIQQYLKCCGYNGNQDPPVQEKSGILISSCCDKTVKVCTKFVAYTEACGEKAVNYMTTMFKIVASFLFCFGVVEVALVCILCCCPY